MTLCVGLLSLSASDEDPKDWAFGSSRDSELLAIFITRASANFQCSLLLCVHVVQDGF